MSFQDNLQKTKINMSVANFITAAIMFIAYFFMRKYDNVIDTKWFLIPGILFVIAGVGIILFINRIQNKYKNID